MMDKWEEYQHLLERIRRGAEYLDNPLIRLEDYQKGMKLYELLCERLEQLKEELE
jgi:exonuclease VII small subunit